MGSEPRAPEGDGARAIGDPSAVLDAFAHCLGLLDERGRIVFLNEALAGELGRNRSDLVGRPLWETPWWANTPSFEVRLGEALERALGGEPVELEEVVSSVEGGSLTVRIEMRLVDTRPGGERRVAWSAVDITEMRDLEEVRSRMAAIVERSPDLVATITPGGRLISLNRAGRALVGIESDTEVVGRALSDFYPGWARTLIEEVARPTAREKGSWMGRSGLIGADGSEIPTSQVIVSHRDDGGSVRFWSTVVRDATNERRAENRLETEVAIGQALDDSVSLDAAIPEILDAFGRFLGADLVEYWVEGDTGLTRLATGGKAPESGYELPGAGTTMLHEALRDGGKPILVCPAGVLGTKVDRVRLPDFATSGLGFPVGSDEGVVGTVTAYWKAEMNDLGLHTSAARIARDISAFVRREQADASLRESRAMAEEASRAKDEFVANMSHEIRSPMTAILGYVEVLGGSLEDPDDRQVLEAIRRNGSHLLDVVSDILDLSRIEANRIDLAPEEIPLAVLVREVIDLMAPRAREQGLEFSTRFEGDIPDRIVTDPVRVRQILVNLLGNAIKFTPEGSVTMVLGMGPELLRFRVDDTGIGMPSDVVDDLFEPFTQVDTSALRPYEGTGLGLAISSRLASALGGHIEVESTLGEGSSFTLSIPVGSAEHDLVGPEEMDAIVRDVEPTPSVPARRLRGRILAVDDRLDMRVLFRHLFEEVGAEVEVAADGEEAVRMVESSLDGEGFGVIVMDVQMPGMDGLTATRRIREIGFRGAIIALTAGARPEDRESAFEAGCDEYAAKPIGGRALVDLVWRHLETPDEERAVDDISGRTVLVIEDDPAVAEVMRTLLEEWGSTVLVAGNGDEALAQGEVARVDVVFCDVTLPGGDGIDLLPRLRETTGCRESVCVSLSGHSGPDVERRSRDAGFVRHLVKPASLDDLREVLAQAGGGGAEVEREAG